MSEDMAERLARIEADQRRLIAMMEKLLRRARRVPPPQPGEGAADPEVTSAVVAKLARGTRRRGQ